MNDTAHGLATIIALSCLCGGIYLLAGLGASLAVFGSLVLSAVIYARLRGTNDVRQSD